LVVVGILEGGLDVEVSLIMRKLNNYVRQPANVRVFGADNDIIYRVFSRERAVAVILGNSDIPREIVFNEERRARSGGDQTTEVVVSAASNIINAGNF
jgi:hypothetical protein